MNDNILERLANALESKIEDRTPLSLVSSYFLSDVAATKCKDTFDYYARQLNTIISYFGQIGVHYISELNKQVLNSFIISSKGKDHKNNTINKRITCLKTALNYCYSHGHITTNNFDFLRKLPKDDVETETISIDLLIKILNYVINLDSNTAFNVRIKMTVFLLIDTGMRLSELRKLRLININLDKLTIKLTETKTRKIRTVFISELTRDYLVNYIEVFKVTDILLIDHVHGKPVHRVTIYKYVFNKIKEDLQIKQSISPHKWRHTYATLCLVNGADLEFVRKTLGHTNLSTTQKYLHLSKEHLHDDHKQFSPLSKIEFKK